MRHPFGLLVLIAIMVSTTFGFAQRLSAEEERLFRTRDQVLTSISGYREDAEPNKLPAFVKAVARLRLLDDDERSGIYFGFVAGILADNQTKAAEFAADMFPLKPEHQIIVIRGLAYSGLPGWKRILKDLTERMPARKKLISDSLSAKVRLWSSYPSRNGPRCLLPGGGSILLRAPIILH